MSSPSKQPQPLKKGGGWGSLLSGAVANLESRLDTILAEEPDSSTRQRTGDAAANAQGRPRSDSGNLSVPGGGRKGTMSRDASRTRVNDRLAERLAKATAAKGPSSVPSRVSSPAADLASARPSGETARSVDVMTTKLPSAEPDLAVVQARGDPEGEVTTPDKTNGSLPRTVIPTTSTSPPSTARHSIESSVRPSLDQSQSVELSGRSSLEMTDSSELKPPKSNAELEAEVTELRASYAIEQKQRQDEMNAYLERIDALQAKLKYLANETIVAAKEANASTSSVDLSESRLAEKDERIALLMQEGEALSMKEMRHLQTIKKLRTKASEGEKAAVGVREELERAGKEGAELKAKLRRAEMAQRQAREQVGAIPGLEKQIETLQDDRDMSSELVATLRTQLKAANERAARAEDVANSKAAEADRGKIAALENDLGDARIERQLADERAAAELKKARDELAAQKSRQSLREGEVANEISVLESRVEAMRSRAEEASSAGVNGGGEETNVRLLRQVDTLQNQYATARQNWESIEGSLTARLSLLEAERDEVVKREADSRRKAREVVIRSRELEDMGERAKEESLKLQKEVQALNQKVEGMQSALASAHAEVEDGKAELLRQRRVWEVETAQKLEQERKRHQISPPNTTRNGTLSITTRKTSSAELSNTHHSQVNSSRRPPTGRLTSHDLHTLQASVMPRRAPDGAPVRTPGSILSPLEASPPISRKQSMISFDQPPTPSIDIDDIASDSSSAHQTINDLLSPALSASTAHAGPSVQLVERLSNSIRRLESQKAASQAETARLASQRDEARNEVVDLMREMQTKRDADGEVLTLKKEVTELRKRYEAGLQMLGEREEEVEELREDVVELKARYRELVEEKVGPAR